VKQQFADYLKSQGIYDLIAPTQAAPATEEKPKDKKESRQPRTDAKVLKAKIARNHLAFKAENYKPNGINKLGEPVKYQGNSGKNAEIKNQMEQDIRDYEDQYGPGSFTTPITLESLEGEHKFLLEPQAEAAPEEAKAPKAARPAATKKNTPVAA
jgi:hypothetical protein